MKIKCLPLVGQLFMFLLLMASCVSTTEEEGAENSGQTDSVAKDSLAVSDSSKGRPMKVFPVARFSDSTSDKGLRFIVQIVNDSIIKFTYKNIGDSAFRLWTETKGYGLTWNTVDLEDEKGKIYTLNFDPGIRTKSGRPFAVELRAGKSVTLQGNLYALIRRKVADKELDLPLSGKYLLSAHYNSSLGPLDRVYGDDLKFPHWSGQLNIGGLSFSLK